MERKYAPLILPVDEHPHGSSRRQFSVYMVDEVDAHLAALQAQHAEALADRVRMSLKQIKTINWLATGEKGISSEAMAFWLAFSVKPLRLTTPRDPADLDRCLQLLEEVPELRPMLPKMGDISAQWKSLIDRWEEIEKSHLDEVGLRWSKGRSAPLTYHLMQSILGD